MKMEPGNLISNNQPKLPDVGGGNKNRVLAVMGAVVLIGAGLYFFLPQSIMNKLLPASVSKENQVKLIDQTVKTIEGTVASVDSKNNMLLLISADNKTYSVEIFPETTLVGFGKAKEVKELAGKNIDMSKFKKDASLSVEYIDAQRKIKEIDLLYASVVEKK